MLQQSKYRQANRVLKAMGQEEKRDISRSLFYLLLGSTNAPFYERIQKSAQPISLPEPFPEGQIERYGTRLWQKT